MDRLPNLLLLLLLFVFLGGVGLVRLLIGSGTTVLSMLGTFSGRHSMTFKGPLEIISAVKRFRYDLLL